jgi:hypothetical protein
MKTSHGAIQRYDGMTTLDGKHAVESLQVERQVIVHAEAFGEAQSRFIETDGGRNAGEF